MIAVFYWGLCPQITTIQIQYVDYEQLDTLSQSDAQRHVQLHLDALEQIGVCVLCDFYTVFCCTIHDQHFKLKVYSRS